MVGPLESPRVLSGLVVMQVCQVAAAFDMGDERNGLCTKDKLQGLPSYTWNFAEIILSL